MSAMRKANMMGMMTAMLGASILGGDQFGSFNRHSPEPQPAKKCLRCGKEHQHNNSFCSAECCRSYKEEKKNG